MTCALEIGIAVQGSSTSQRGKVQEMLMAWPDLNVCLNIGHFMRWLAVGCSTYAHMAMMASCILELDPMDMVAYNQTSYKKRSPAALPEGNPWLYLNQFPIRGTAEKSGRPQDADSLGVPLFNDEWVWQIWSDEKRHIKCIQDVEGIPLYVTTGKRWHVFKHI